MDEKSNILSGCTFEMLLNLHGSSIKNIIIDMITPVDFDEVVECAKNIISNQNTTDSKHIE